MTPGGVARGAIAAAVALALVGGDAGVARADERIKLPNGLRVVLAPDPEASTVVALAWYAVGTDDGIEPALVEQLAFGATTHLAAGRAEASIEAAGGWVQVAAARDHTSATTLVPPGALALALQLEAERMAGLPDGFTAATVTAAAVAVARDRAARPAELAIARALAGHAGGAAPTPTVAALAAFYRAHYTAASTLIVIAGRFDAATAKQLVAQDFGWMSAPAGTADAAADAHRPGAAIAAPPAQLAKAVDLAIAGSGAAAREIAFAFATDRPFAAATAATSVAAAILAGGPRSRLARALVDELHLATDVRERITPTATGGELAIEVRLAPGADPAAVRARFSAELADLRAGHATADEVARAVGTLDARLVRSLENLAFRADALAREATWSTTPELLATTRARLRAVDATAVAAVATTWLADSALVTATTTPSPDTP